MPHRPLPDGYVGLPRRDFLRLASSAVLLTTPLKSAFGEQQRQQRLIRFGLTPVLLNTDLDLLSLLQNYLETETGYPIELVTRRTYQEITTLLISGQLEAAWICGYPYVKYRDDLELVAVPEWNGKPLYRSYLIVGTNRRAENFRDLKGDIHAFSDPDSNSDYLVTRTLMFELGLDPETFFSKTLFTYGHRNVVRAVASDLAQSGSVDGYVWEVLREREPSLANKTRILRKSELLGFPPVATSRALASTPSIAALKSALLKMQELEQGRKVLNELGLTGFTDAPPSIFDGIAAKVTKLQGVL